MRIRDMCTPRRSLILVVGLIAATASIAAQEGFKFKSGVELVNVTATVSDRDGRFVPGLTKDDFTVYEDGHQQDITQFSNERVPVSLGILLDTSGSMTPDKMSYAKAAIDRFVNQLLDDEDELFFADFNNRVHIDQEWTTNRRLISKAASRVEANGGTALYDSVARLLPVTARGMHQKKALLVITDGNDTDSYT